VAGAATLKRLKEIGAVEVPLSGVAVVLPMGPTFLGVKPSKKTHKSS
jgi:hypothetical protein